MAGCFVAYSTVANWRMRGRYERHADRMVGWIVQANSALYQPGNMNLPAQVIVAFGGQGDEPDPAVAEIAKRAGSLKTRQPETPEEATVAEIVRDETYRPFVRYQLPKEFTGGREVYSLHVLIERSLLHNGALERPYVRCLLYRGHATTRVLMAAYRPSDNGA